MRQDLADLAAGARARAFALCDGVDVLVTLEPEHIGYLSGYRSMSYDTSRHYQSAAVATRDEVYLVVGAFDAAPAMEVVPDPRKVMRYGTFYFVDYPADAGMGRSFEAALMDAIELAAGSNSTIGLDVVQEAVGNRLRDLFQPRRVVNASSTLVAARAVKSPAEIEKIRRATHLVEQGISAVIANAARGMTEWDAAALITREMVAGGGVPRFVAVTSGPRSALADAYPTTRALREGDLVRMDVGCTVDGYWSDMARTAVVGEPTAGQRADYRAIKIGLLDQIKSVKAGITAAACFKAAVESVRAAGIRHYQRHHCGHGIGVLPNEFPRLSEDNDAPLQDGMVLCVETPYYVYGQGGMMVEDTIVVRPNGFEPLTTLSHELAQLRA